MTWYSCESWFSLLLTIVLILAQPGLYFRLSWCKYVSNWKKGAFPPQKYEYGTSSEDYDHAIDYFLSRSFEVWSRRNICLLIYLVKPSLGLAAQFTFSDFTLMAHCWGICDLGMWIYWRRFWYLRFSISPWKCVFFFFFFFLNLV